MAPPTPEPGSPAREALEASLTLNKKQSWFGSIKSAVHQSALSAKAAVESLRIGSSSSNSPSLADTGTPCNSNNASPTPNRGTLRGGTASKATAPTLREQLSRRSRTNRGSISSVFRRSNSNASSLRGMKSPASSNRNSQDLNTLVAPLTKTRDDESDTAASVPLPSSPIAIPSPVLPALKLDFGPPMMLQQFPGMMEADLADAKVLQDPRNITKGHPSQTPTDWAREKPRPHPLRNDSVVSNLARSRGELEKVAIDLACLENSQTPAEKQDDPFVQTRPPLHTAGSSKGKTDKHEMLPPVVSEDTFKLSTMILAKVEADIATSDLHRDSPKAPQQEEKKIDSKPSHNPCSLDLLEQHEQAKEAKGSGMSFEDAMPAVTFADIDATLYPDRGSYSSFGGITHYPKTPFPQPTQDQSQQSTTASLAMSSSSNGTSDSMAAQAPCTPRSEGSWLPRVGLEPMTPVRDAQVLSSPSPISNKTLRKHSILEESDDHSIPFHGPPSPSRPVQLPLRPKSTLVKRSSYDSMVFQPILDRLAAKHLGVFRPGSDPTLRQRYFQQVNNLDSTPLLESPRHASLDSRVSKTSNKTSSSEESGFDDSGIFERAVEPISPLHIRKHSNNAAVPKTASPCTPNKAIASGTPGSSPTRTPSMGDKQLWETQRAERNARYNAIHSDCHDVVVDDDSNLQLADFDYAGPGSRGSTPGRNSEEKGSGVSESPVRSDRAGPVYQVAQASRLARKEGLLALSKD